VAHSSRDDVENTPQRAQIRDVVDRLLTGSLSRTDASKWAVGALDLLDASDRTDEAAEEVLECLIGIDSVQTDETMNVTGYLFDFAELRELRATIDVDDRVE
jgi:hypothetical protein